MKGHYDETQKHYSVVPRYNIAPTQIVTGIVAEGKSRRLLTGILWSLTPPWAEKEGSAYGPQINIRDDTIDKNKFFQSLLVSRRCVFLADGFYEWKKPEGFEKKPAPKGVHKTPYRIGFKDDRVFALACLWREMETEQKSILPSAAIITTSPNDLMKPIHNRMPVILENDALDLWLDPSNKDVPRLRKLLAPYPDKHLTAFPISTAVNNARYDGEDIIKPLAE
jgi:putative SOS response-associated peptidase YedK